MTEAVKRVDQQRHELKALRYLLDSLPDCRTSVRPFPSRDDFQILDCQQIYDAMMRAITQADAIAAIRALDLESTEIESFLSLGGKHYYTYPALVVERGKQFRNRALEIVD